MFFGAQREAVGEDLDYIASLCNINAHLYLTKIQVMRILQDRHHLKTIGHRSYHFVSKRKRVMQVKISEAFTSS